MASLDRGGCSVIRLVKEGIADSVAGSYRFAGRVISSTIDSAGVDAWGVVCGTGISMRFWKPLLVLSGPEVAESRIRAGCSPKSASSLGELRCGIGEFVLLRPHRGTGK